MESVVLYMLLERFYCLQNWAGTLAVILPGPGQILVGLVIDHFGFFYSLKTPISVFRIFGAVLVVAGVVIVSLAKREAGKNNPKENAHADIWLWRIFGVLSGALSGVYTRTLTDIWEKLSILPPKRLLFHLQLD